MSSTGLPLPEGPLAAVAEQYGQALQGLRTRVRRALTVEGASFLLLAFSCYFVVSWPIDRFFRLEWQVRAVLLVAWLGWVVFVLARRVVRPLGLALDDDELALAVERSDATLGQRLISSVQFYRSLQSGAVRNESPALMSQVIAALPATLDCTDVGAALHRGRVRKSWLGLAGAGVFLVAVGTLYPQFGLWARRNLLLASIEWPRATLLQVVNATDGVVIVPRGDDFTIEVDADGVVPETVKIDYWFPDGSGARETMTQNVGEARFSFTFPGLMDPIEFYAWGGDGETPEIRVRLVDRPSLSALSVRLEYPEYMRRDPQALPDDAGEIMLPRGAELDVTATASKPLQKAELAVGEAEVAPAEVAGDRLTIRGRIRPAGSGLFRVKMLDTDHLTEGAGRRLLLRVVPDKAPRVMARLRGIGAWITSKARIPVELGVVDDFGLQEITMLWGVGDTAAVGSGEGQEKRFQPGVAEGLAESFQPGSLVFERLVAHDLLPLLKDPANALDEANPVRPGMFVALRFQARDNHPEGIDDRTGQASTSDTFTFKVVTESELLRELNRRQSEQRVEFEKVFAKEQEDRGDFGELEDPRTPGEIGEGIRNRLQTLARQQRSLARRVLLTADSYGQILDEMINNRVGDAVGGGEATVRRRRMLIVDALETLGKRTMPDIAKLVQRYGQTGDPDLRSLALSGYDDALRAMERILREMKKLESFTEILTKLQDVIRLEGSAAEKTREKLKADLEGLFGPGKQPPKDEGK